MKVETPEYKNVLVAIDPYSTFQPVMNRALKLVSSPDQISLIHVTLPYAYFEPYSLEIGQDFVSDMLDKSKAKLTEIADTHGIPKQNVHAVLGNASDEIHQVAEDNLIDLIVIGTHGQSGLKLLLGSTANSVLHGAKCDVLAVRV